MSDVGWFYTAGLVVAILMGGANLWAVAGGTLILMLILWLGQPAKKKKEKD